MKRIACWALLLALLTVPAGVAAQERTWPWGWHDGMHPMWWMWGAWGVGMMLVMLVFWGLVITGIVLAIRWLLNVGPRRDAVQDSALQILRERYARGELSREEFEARKRDLA